MNELKRAGKERTAASAAQYVTRTVQFALYAKILECRIIKPYLRRIISKVKPGVGKRTVMPTKQGLCQ